MIEQRSEAWWEGRRGIPTGSRASDIIKLSPGYIRELIAERSGEPRRESTAAATEWGNLNEDRAIAAYELMTDVDTEPGHLVFHPDKLTDEGEPYFRGTPDFFVGDVGLVEVKCPYDPGIHMATVVNGIVPEQHVCQMEAYLGMTRRVWCDFVSFDPRAEPGLQLFVRRYYGDPQLQHRICEMVDVVWKHVVQGTVPAVDLNDIPEIF